jgi:hypothetical protein
MYPQELEQLRKKKNQQILEFKKQVDELLGVLAQLQKGRT